MTQIRQPCVSCPWRLDTPRGYWDPDHFREIWQNCQDDGTHLMACHKSRRGRSRICQGWVRVLGYGAIGVRLAVMRGQASIDEVDDRSGPRLFRSFAAMLRANRVRLPRRNTQLARMRQRTPSRGG